MKAIVVGCGRMGARHIEALLGQGIDVIGVFDLNNENALSVISKYNLKQNVLYNNSDGLFAKTAAEICVISTTAPSHKSYVENAITSGISKILCEKPLATSLQDCLYLDALAKTKKVDVAVNHQMRYLEQYTIPKQLLNTAEFGGLEAINISAGNFGMSMNGIHYIEMLRFMSDDKPKKITAWFDKSDIPNPRGPEYFDKSGSLKIITTTGKKFHLDASCTNGHGIIVTYCGKLGQIVVDELSGHMYVTRRNSNDKDLPTTRYGQQSVIETTSIKAVDIITSTQSVLKDLLKGSGFPNIENAALAIKTLVAGYVSNEYNNTTIDIDDYNIPTERVFPWA